MNLRRAALMFAASWSLVAPAIAGEAYASRDGEAEALGDITAGKPLKIYSHVFNGRAPGFRSPGLTGCDPRYSADDRFIVMPEAAWQEGETYTPAELQAAAEANRFAAQYNRTIYRLRTAEIVRVCPAVKLSPP